MNIGKTIKKLRKEKKLNQTDFSVQCNLSQTTLSQIERGTTRPTQKNLDRICSELGVPEYLLYILSVEDADIPEEKKETFQQLFPPLKDLMLKLLGDDRPFTRG